MDVIRIRYSKTNFLHQTTKIKKLQSTIFFQKPGKKKNEPIRTGRQYFQTDKIGNFSSPRLLKRSINSVIDKIFLYTYL